MDLTNLSITSVRGIGEKKAEAFAQLDIHTVADLLEYFPYRYDDFRVKRLSSSKDGEKITVLAQIHGYCKMQQYGRKKSRLVCPVITDEKLITAVWFNQAYLKDKLLPGRKLYITGKWDSRRNQITVSSFEFLDKSRLRANAIQPVYTVRGSLTQKTIRQAIEQALKQYFHAIEENLPDDMITKYKLMPRRDAIRFVHMPRDIKQLKLARRRLKYEELFLFQLKLQAFRGAIRRKEQGITRQFDKEALQSFIQSLPFPLTTSQQKVIQEIVDDLQQPYHMNRLLQGDVGSGKTVVAAVALYANYLSGYQGALMVPTEILAEQHKASLKQMFEPFGVQVELLTGSLTQKQKRDVTAAIQMGMIDIVIGTHALIQEHVYFNQLGLVVTDEQHRFGVQQRSVLPE